MKRSFKNKLLIVLFAIASLCIFAGCSFNKTLDEFLSENELVAQVTYYANGGKFEDDRTYKDIYLKAGFKVQNIGTDKLVSGSSSISRTAYEFNGWYFAELDEEGNVVYDEYGSIVKGELVDFSVAIQAGEHWKLCADWLAHTKVNMYLVCEDGDVVVSEELSYKSGDLIGQENFSSQGLVQKGNKPPIQPMNDAYTFVEYYADEACTQLTSWPIKQGDADVNVYAKYIEGKWTIVKDRDDVKAMFNGSGSRNNRFYLLGDIDCAGLTVAPLSTIQAEWRGNGYTIANLTVTRTSALGNGEKVAVFGKINEAARISDITFENLNATFSTRPNVAVEAYFVCLSVHESAQISGFTVGGTLTVTRGENSNLINAPAIGDGFELGHWKFGGVERDEAYTGITVTEDSQIIL